MGVDVSKETAYTVLSPAQDAAAVSKETAYTVLSPSQTAVAVSKLTSYTVLAFVTLSGGAEAERTFMVANV